MLVADCTIHINETDSITVHSGHVLTVFAGLISIFSWYSTERQSQKERGERGGPLEFQFFHFVPSLVLIQTDIYTTKRKSSEKWGNVLLFSAALYIIYGGLEEEKVIMKLSWRTYASVSPWHWKRWATEKWNFFQSYRYINVLKTSCFISDDVIWDVH